MLRGVGSRHLELDVDPIVENYTEIVSRALDMKLDWEHHDIALQNIQARRACTQCLDDRQSDWLLVIGQQQSERVGRGLRDDGWRHVRRIKSAGRN